MGEYTDNQLLEMFQKILKQGIWHSIILSIRIIRESIGIFEKL